MKCQCMEKKKLLLPSDGTLNQCTIEVQGHTHLFHSLLYLMRSPAEGMFITLGSLEFLHQKPDSVQWSASRGMLHNSRHIHSWNLLLHRTSRSSCFFKYEMGLGKLNCLLGIYFTMTSLFSLSKWNYSAFIKICLRPCLLMRSVRKGWNEKRAAYSIPWSCIPQNRESTSQNLRRPLSSPPACLACSKIKSQKPFQATWKVQGRTRKKISHLKWWAISNSAKTLDVCKQLEYTFLGQIE